MVYPVLGCFITRDPIGYQGGSNPGITTEDAFTKLLNSGGRSWADCAVVRQKGTARRGTSSLATRRRSGDRIRWLLSVKTCRSDPELEEVPAKVGAKLLLW